MSRRGLPGDAAAATPAQAVVAAVDQPTGSDSAGQALFRPPQNAAPERAKLTVQLPREVIEELRDAVVALPTRGVQATVAGLVEQAVCRELALLREEYFDGEAPPARATQPRAGRPIGR